MGLQAIIGQRSFNCHVGDYAWIRCDQRHCGKLYRVKRTQQLLTENAINYCSVHCYLMS